MLNVLPCYLHILVYILNIHESISAQVGHLHRPSRYAAFYTILNASARHVTSPVSNVCEMIAVWRLSCAPVIACHLDGKRVHDNIMT